MTKPVLISAHLAKKAAVLKNKKKGKKENKSTQTWTENLKFEASCFTIKLSSLYNKYPRVFIGNSGVRTHMYVCTILSKYLVLPMTMFPL